jgi:Protein of unknown function (DUF3303)
MDRCFQLMETSDPALFDVWFERWNDLVSFEVYPVFTSAEAVSHIPFGDADAGTYPPGGTGTRNFVAARSRADRFCPVFTITLTG